MQGRAVQAEGPVRKQGGPGGRGTNERREASLPPRQRRLGGWYHAGPGGTVERDVWNTRAGEMHGTQTEQIRSE
jgi:hypothetical protein